MVPRAHYVDFELQLAEYHEIIEFRKLQNTIVFLSKITLFEHLRYSKAHQTKLQILRY